MFIISFSSRWTTVMGKCRVGYVKRTRLVLRSICLKLRTKGENRRMIKSLNRANIERRDFCLLTGGAVASLMLSSACRRVTSTSAIGDGRLSARTSNNVKTTVSGKIALNTAGDRDAILQVPAKASNSAVPLLVFLHGAGQSAAEMLEYMGSVPEEAG